MTGSPTENPVTTAAPTTTPAVTTAATTTPVGTTVTTTTKPPLCVYNGIGYKALDEIHDPINHVCHTGVCKGKDNIQFVPDAECDHCTNGTVWQLCGSHRTCDAPADQSSCKPGCYCPEDMAMQDGMCVRTEDCKKPVCEHNGKMMKEGESFEDEGCRKCTCIGGQMECYEKCHLTPAICKAQGFDVVFNENFDDMKCCECRYNQQCTDSDGNPRKVGEMWKSNLCTTHQCTLMADNRPQLETDRQTCQNCSDDFDSVVMPGECCPLCVPKPTTVPTTPTIITTPTMMTTTQTPTTTPISTTTVEIMTGQPTIEPTTTPSVTTTEATVTTPATTTEEECDLKDMMDPASIGDVLSIIDLSSNMDIMEKLLFPDKEWSSNEDFPSFTVTVSSVNTEIGSFTLQNAENVEGFTLTVYNEDGNDVLTRISHNNKVKLNVEGTKLKVTITKKESNEPITLHDIELLVCIKPGTTSGEIGSTSPIGTTATTAPSTQTATGTVSSTTAPAQTTGTEGITPGSSTTAAPTTAGESGCPADMTETTTISVTASSNQEMAAKLKNAGGSGWESAINDSNPSMTVTFSNSSPVMVISLVLKGLFNVESYKAFLIIGEEEELLGSNYQSEDIIQIGKSATAVLLEFTPRDTSNAVRAGSVKGKACGKPKEETSTSSGTTAPPTTPGPTTTQPSSTTEVSPTEVFTTGSQVSTTRTEEPTTEPRQEEACVVSTAEKQMTMTIADRTCVSTGMVKMTSCGGTCQSSTMITGRGVDTDCKCCQPQATKMMNIQFKCDGDREVTTHEVMEILSCSCLGCVNNYNP